MRIDAEFELAGEEYSYSVELLKNALVLRERLGVNGQAVFEHKQGKWVTSPQAVSSNPPLCQHECSASG